MIYLIDDKKNRQREFGWAESRFLEYSKIIKPLYTIDEVMEVSQELYQDNNIILYHESFLDFTLNRSKAQEQRNKLIEISKANNLLSVAFFSGSQNTRTLINNTAYLPVSTVYRNLDALIHSGSNNLNILLFGENHEIEKKLDDILSEKNREIEPDPISIYGENLFIRTSTKYIQNAIEHAQEAILFADVSDKKLGERVDEWLNEKEFDNIFLPLCFGPTLSDFNGLRLATHIRCTKTKNQLKRIFIYGIVGLDYLLEHEYFNILKTKNIQLISYNKKAFRTAVNTYFDSFKLEELSKEIQKLKLDPPLNYADNHSIANEFGIFQLAYNAGIDINEISDFDKDKIGSIYFKWLIAKNGLYEELPEDIQNENNIFRNEIQLKGPTIVGKVDLSKVPKK
jgi:hypothetical protein